MEWDGTEVEGLATQDATRGQNGRGDRWAGCRSVWRRMRRTDRLLNEVVGQTDGGAEIDRRLRQTSSEGQGGQVSRHFRVKTGQPCYCPTPALATARLPFS